MPFDEYDLFHNTNFDKIINFYKNSTIEKIISDFMKNIDTNTENSIPSIGLQQQQENQELTHNISKIIFELIDGLKILEDRHITNIGARLFHNVINDDNETYTTRCYLVQVWRGAQKI
jgi:hypothetical protein